MRGNGLPDTITFEKYAPAKTSWWLEQSSREAFVAAHQRELQRMTQARIKAPGETRTIDTFFGRT